MRASAFAVLLAVAAAAATPAPYGVLLLAHGGDPSWNAEIAALRARTDARVPTETALGMADTTAMQDAVDRLKARGVGRIVAVPLFVSSRSEVLDQTRYALGLSKKPSEVLRAAFARMGAAHAPTRPGGGGSAAHAHHGHAHAFSTERVRLPLPLVMSPALDDHPLVASILLERARALSRDANKESVVLVAHGPVDDAALPAWTDTLAALCARVRSEGAFREVSYGVLRDDAAPAVRAAAVADLRARVSAGARAGRALVIPVLIARGGIEGKIVKDLSGLTYAWDGKTLMPHPGFDAWVLERAAASAR